MIYTRIYLSFLLLRNARNSYTWVFITPLQRSCSWKDVAFDEEPECNTHDCKASHTLPVDNFAAGNSYEALVVVIMLMSKYNLIQYAFALIRAHLSFKFRSRSPLFLLGHFRYLANSCFWSDIYTWNYKLKWSILSFLFQDKLCLSRLPCVVHEYSMTSMRTASS